MRLVPLASSASVSAACLRAEARDGLRPDSGHLPSGDDDGRAAQRALAGGRSLGEPGAAKSRAEQRGLYWPTVGVVGRYVHLNDELFVDLSPLHDLLSALNPARRSRRSARRCSGTTR